MRTRSKALAPVAALLLLPSCVLVSRPSGIVVSSDPPGATVLIDRHDSGFVTPCVLDVDADDDKRVDIELKGYEPETRFLTKDHEVYTILWREMSVGYKTFDFPLFLNFRDFFVPVKYRETVAPGRIHVRLDRKADSVSRAAAAGRSDAP
ncbi:MAG: PEGA domain-containing protein [Planctomycetes bacterium]|nr:PEGA domain-containing protein [Planctomycetota bacterium]